MSIPQKGDPDSRWKMEKKRKTKKSVLTNQSKRQRDRRALRRNF